MELHLDSYDVVPSQVGVGSDLLTIPLRGHRDMESAQSVYTFASRYPVTGQIGRTFLSISPEAYLVRQAGSVAFDWSSSSNETTANLIVESDAYLFYEKCVAESLLRITVPQNEQTYTFVNIGNETVQERSLTRFRTFSDCTVALVPDRVFTLIENQLEAAGSQRIDGLMVYSNCSTTTIQSLPEIRIDFPNIGKIVLYPDEYMVVSGEGQCTMLLMRLGHFAVIDPFKLAGMNVRISRGRIWEFCDARY